MTLSERGTQCLDLLLNVDIHLAGHLQIAILEHITPRLFVGMSHHRLVPLLQQLDDLRTKQSKHGTDPAVDRP